MSISTCSPHHTLSATSDITKVQKKERLSQPGAGGIMENMRFNLDLKEKKKLTEKIRELG